MKIQNLVCLIGRKFCLIDQSDKENDPGAFT